MCAWAVLSLCIQCASPPLLINRQVLINHQIGNQSNCITSIKQEMEDGEVSRRSKSDFGEADLSSEAAWRSTATVKHESKHWTGSSQGNISGEQLNSEVELNVAREQRLITHNEEVRAASGRHTIQSDWETKIYSIYRKRENKTCYCASLNDSVAFGFLDTEHTRVCSHTRVNK